MKLIFNILWLDVNIVNFTNTLPNRKDRIMKTSMTIFSVEITIEKNGRREKYFKTNMR
jgi:hypothetical protein